MELIAHLCLFLVVAYVSCKLIDVAASFIKVKRIKKNKKKQKGKFKFDIDVSVHSKSGHTHDSEYLGKGKFLLKGGAKAHEHMMELSENEMKELSEKGSIDVNSTFTDAFDVAYHSHILTLTL